ncbi:MAG: T9SS type A sorting domain-containing protein [Flavobacteriia bacterium]|nr:T9SS type A sorting domain-containing protein [Flavobacteriia bacterium]
MKKLLVCLLLAVQGISQNLVQNPSFEDFDSCPNQNNSNSIFEYVPFWKTLYFSTSYLNSCSVTNFGIPNNLFVNSFQESHFGNAYCALDIINAYGLHIRTFIQNQFSQSLQISNCYYVEFYTNLANNVMYASNNLAVYFTNSSNIPLKSGYEYLLEGSPQIYPFGNKIISDTMNWVKVAGIYKAQGGEQYLTIGNFSTDEETEILIFDPNAYDAAFYYIDDVSVIPINPSSMPANAGEDKLVAPGDSIFIGQEITNLDCKWTNLNTGEILADSISGIWVQPTENTTYLVEQNLCGTISYDTVTVFVNGVGLEESSPLIPLQRGKVEIIPNPNNGSFTIQTNLLEIQELTLYDAQARKLYNLDKNSTKMDLNLPKGVYFLKIISENSRNLEKVVVN